MHSTLARFTPLLDLLVALPTTFQTEPAANPFTGLMTQFMGILNTLTVPAAVIGITVAILGYILIPIVPALQQQRGYIQMALIGVVAIGFVPGIVSLAVEQGQTATPAGSRMLPLALDHQEDGDLVHRTVFTGPQQEAHSAVMATPTVLG